ncbi:AAA family ATPase [Clostridium sp.]|uniref:AAA family ATPase n=1 Tax=Clostridium sp. TaxID=1506 RepID=UPI00283FFBFB|nr:AAA family ATPase [Clostridium sp.]MDR3594561.1 AAA family ATPase [Clostridium sp.]
MDTINIFFVSDDDFNNAVAHLDNFNTISDLLNHISKTEVSIIGAQNTEEPPLKIENLVMYTDDYGSIKEWALLGFSNNILQHSKVHVLNIWINNPPNKFYTDIKKAYPNIIKEHKMTFQGITIEILKKISQDFNSAILGQDNVIKQILSPIYSLKNPNRKRPVTILFLGESGVGKTETAKYVSSFIGKEIVRIQFSMQQTSDAYQYIFGADHSENSLARELIRRKSNVILLDEFDKVHPSFYNAFYQMFDEGVFVDANYSVNMEKCIIFCTTNYLSEKDAEKCLGIPIYSRFSKIVRFDTISLENRIKIAKKNYEELFKQLDVEDQALIFPNQIMEFYIEQIAKGYYKNMRMLKNDIEDAINFEILKAHKIF